MIKTYCDNQNMYAVIENDLENSLEDISDLIRIQHDFLNSDCKKLVFRFTGCKIINAAVSVIIGTLPEYVKIYDKRVLYRFSGEGEHPVLIFMKNVGMYNYYTKDEIDYTGSDVIPFNLIKNEKMMDEYADRIMTMAPIKMQKEAQDILKSYIYEIYQNGLFHSNSYIGVYTSGIWLKEKKEFVFSIYDMGVGIPDKIRMHDRKYGNIDSEKCLRIAFIDGFSTSNDKLVNRGLGLTRLEKFIELNNGKMSIYTDNVCCIIEGKKGKRFHTLSSPIKGTLIIINIAADENHIYVIEKEKKYE